ncbi:MAG: DUF86 domain-containing protein [Thermomicrobiales bacterium]|jgi:uncharacterized protein with HEPN domain|nr:DUF86 domain-containing protein [Thermomicrobiales bacterium]
MNRRAAKSLLDAISACSEIEGLVGQPSLDAFLSDRNRQLVAERLIVAVGESLHQAEIEEPLLGDSVPDLKKIVGMRHVVAHGYRDIRPEIVWEAAVHRVPPLRLLLLEMIDQYSADS